MKRSKQRIAVIGTGITGLTTAYKLQKKINEENLPYELLILESAIHSGGNIFTMKLDDYYFDLGVDSIDVREKDALELIEELGLEDQLVYSQNGKEDLFIHNQMYQLNFPTYKGIPEKLKYIWKYKSLTLSGKLAFLRESYLPTITNDQDVDISSYMKQRIGNEMTDYIVEPFLSSNYMGDIEQVGIKSSKNPLYDLEQEYGSFTKAIQEHPELLDGDGNYVTFERGLRVLTEKIIEKLGGNIRYNQRVTEIKPSSENTYILDINNKQQVRVGAVCIASGPSSYNSFFDDEKLNTWADNLQKSSMGHMLFSFPKGSIKRPPKGFGVLVPTRSESYITSVTLLNKKWPFYGQDQEFVGVEFGRMGDNFLMSLSNKQLEEFILKELQKMIQITEEPIYRIVKRWPEAIVQYKEDHNQRKSFIRQHIRKEYPGVYIAGNGFDGYGINYCIRQANEVSDKVLNYIKANRIKK